MTDDLAIVVVSRLGPGAKSRLAPVLSEEGRSVLAHAMLLDVLATCVDARLCRLVLLVADDPRGWLGRLSDDVERVADPNVGLNAAVRAGLDEAARRGVGAALVLPGDVPLATASELRSLASAAQGHRQCVGVARDRARAGTNGLVLRPTGAIEPAFGVGSAARHASAGRAAGAAVRMLDLPGLGLDVDTPSDLALLREARPRGWTGEALRRLSVGDTIGEPAVRS